MDGTTRPPQSADVRSGAADGRAKPQESLRDTIESVVVAFILAFVFRAFVVEAFVIPTGSMADTLYGEHWTHDCSNCGYEFAVGANRQDGRIADSPTQLRCPNCNVEDEVRLSSTTIESGDRILVLKWPLDLSSVVPSLGPKRWDVTVFKDPEDGETNFIKRLVGLPDEVLMILDGDIYTAATGDLPPDLTARLETLRELNYRLGQTRDEREARPLKERIHSLRPEVSHDLAPYLHIEHKPEGAQGELWSIVYNHDRPSRRYDGGLVGRPGWAPAGSSSGWRVSPGSLVFDGIGRPADVIRFGGERVVDDYAYNIGFSAADRQSRDVADLRLRFVLIPEEGGGEVRAALSKYDRTFVATLRADGSVLLSGSRLDSPDEVVLVGQGKIGAFRRDEPIEVDVRNVDYRVSVRVDGREVIATTDEDYSPPVLELEEARNGRAGGDRPLAEVALVAENLRCELKHVTLERDVYYRSPTIRGAGHAEPCPWEGEPGWGTTGNPIHLRAGEYFVLGDNSPASQDGRLWWRIGDHLAARGEDYQVGTVPRDQLIGKAFFVYWPSGYRLPFVRWGLIPNVGRMRWIH